MQVFLIEHIAALLVALTSLAAVLVSMFRARARHTIATAAAFTELTDASHDLRRRVNALEDENRSQVQVITDLRRQVAQIPVLEAQVRFLNEELARVKARHAGERDDLQRVVERKEREIERLRAALDGSGLVI
ncbi:MAG: hypothetical protein AAFV33_02565 [Chloroflexota bacterium]